MSLDQVLNTFIAESQELLETMETQLLALEQDPTDKEAINALFRAAHTIKGSSGMFGMDAVVTFTHTMETLLDRVRSDKQSLTTEMIAELLIARDHIAELIDHLAVQQLPLDDEKALYGAMLSKRLQALQETEAPEVTISASANAPSLSHDCIDCNNCAQNDVWHISLRCGPNILRQGNDPAAMIRCLQTMGEVVSVHPISDQLPPLTEMDPETLYLGFEIALCSQTEKSAIEEVFEWVADDCDIRILPPNSLVADYVSLIHSLPEDPYMLGEILVSSGVLTRKELDQALIRQAKEQKDRGDVSKPLGQVLVEQELVPPPVVEAALERQKQARDVKQQENRFIRVNADKLDTLINLVGELVITGSAAQLQAQISGMSHLAEVNAQINTLVEEIRDSALKLRMVEIGETFNRFNRVVRDISKELGKDIRLVLQGTDTELDKTVVEKIADPLVHLVRNAMDHGIEAPEVRQQAGKPLQGTIRLNAYHDSGNVVIEISDDGGGMRKERILQKAISNGLVAPHQTLSDREIFALVFEPGFSTAEQVSNLSGRGVGMDVVKRNIEALRGSVSIDSTEGQGTRILIRLPLTLAIIDGFLVKVGQDAFVVPLDMVVECLELEAEQTQTASEQQYVNLRGEVLPFIRLREHFALGGQAGKRENIVVVQVQGQKAGLVVDQLLGEHQTVIKPLGMLFNHLKSIGGSTILGNGEVALILDVPSLMSRACQP